MLKNNHNTNTLIWDWNGTLLNDTDICIASINELLTERNLPEISREKYLEMFGFPVIDYYKRIGFDFEKEPFDIPAIKYIEIYTSKIPESSLHPAVPEVLNHFRQKGFKQLVLSASEHEKLIESIKFFKIFDYFDDISGLDNHFAVSKTTLGIKMLNKLNLLPSQACLIGDTEHDFEVAEAIGCKCILIADGHQSRHRLEKTGALIVNNLEKLFSCFQ